MPLQPSPVHQKKSRIRPMLVLLKYLSILFGFFLLMLTIVPLAYWAFTAPEYDGYNYYTYRNIDSNRNYIAAGDPFPGDLFVYLPDGTPVPMNSLWQDKPLVIETASNSCPIFWESEVSMADIVTDYKEDAHVLVLYTREAHPGVLAPAHRDFKAKLKQARKMKASLTQPVVVDAHEGTLHAQMGSGPNSVYIVGTDGIVAHYAYWNDPAVTQEKLKALLDAGGTTESIALSANPCRDPSKALEDFDGDMMRTMVLGIVNAGGLDAMIDFMSFMFTAEGGEDPLCELGEEPGA
ncbi:MAG: hypothetical protein KTR29_01965 [Rhodothermaceae bacterium]|nr:hypothetical protein [Rhodothermaceae bacterium]